MSNRTVSNRARRLALAIVLGLSMFGSLAPLGVVASPRASQPDGNMPLAQPASGPAAPAVPGPDNNVEYNGLGHDSQSSLYRTPFGAVTIGATVTVRFRTFANDVTGVTARLYSTASASESLVPMTRVASHEICQDAALVADRCDFWQIQVTPAQRGVVYYRFIVQDGSATAYYADDGNFDGGWGTATPGMIDRSYPIVVYQPDFAPIEWLQKGVMYQIFPDRFRNGDLLNDPLSGQPRYDDPVLKLPWTTLPEGYCRNYSDAASSCPWRFSPIPAWGVGQPETPRGRDYMGGDLKGVKDKLGYLQDLGVTVIYLNPVFDAGSNHSYDTQNYLAIDPYFGTKADWDALVAAADARGMKIILDGVFNHVSSDSKYFDRYGQYPEIGACESITSTYRAWFSFTNVASGAGTCAGAAGPLSATYDGWFGFDSIPVLNKNNAQVRELVYTGTTNVAAYWLNEGAAGWRLDVMGDGSFPADFWQGFRQTVKTAKADAPIIGELWKRDEMLPKIHGDQADTGMNYRFRNAILGFFGKVDGKGFPDDGQSNQAPSVFARKLNSVREDYPDAVYYTLMNLMGSHDTMRILWNLTPGAANTRAEKEFNAANLAAGKQLLRLATLTQMGIPGVPTIYYGDEVGLTGEDDPDDRRTFPWLDQNFSVVFLPLVSRGATGGLADRAERPATPPAFGAGGDLTLRDDFRAYIAARQSRDVFSMGALTFPDLHDSARTMVMMLRSITDTAMVAVNRDSVTRTLIFTPTGQIPDGLVLQNALAPGEILSAVNARIEITLGPLSGAMLVSPPGQDQTAPDAPSNLTAAALTSGVALTWDAVGDAARYALYRSPVVGGGYTAVTLTASTGFTDTSVSNGRRYFYVVRAIDAAGNEGAMSNEATAVPAWPVAWAIIQSPKTVTTTLGITPTENIYGQVWVPGLTDAGGPTSGIIAELGYGAIGSAPSSWTNWKGMAYNVTVGNNYEYFTTLLPQITGTFDMIARFSTNLGLNWVYADRDGVGISNPARLIVLDASDTTPPAAPTLTVTGVAGTQVRLSWTSVPDAAQYWLYRRVVSGTYGAPTAVVTTTSYNDNGVTTGVPYSYVVRAVDNALNVSPDSNEVGATPTPQQVAVTFNVTVPAGTPVTSTVYIVGNQAAFCNWCNPHTVSLTLATTNVWTITLSFPEGTNLAYKYTLGSWNYVQKGGSCQELGDNTVSVGNLPTQVVNNTVVNWRNVAPCGN